MWNKASKLVALIFGATLSFLGISTSATQAQTFETFYVSGNKALNTNWNFRRIDGFPRMSLWDRNDNDRDQQFERIRGNRGGTLLKHRSTGLCLNAHYLANSREVNTWTCDANDVDQNFNFQDLGGGTFLIKRNDSFCVDSPTRDNLGRIHLINCQANNVNQQWRSSNIIAPPPPPPPVQDTSIESVLKRFFGNTANTINENWSGKNITEMWDRVGGEDAQFPNGNFPQGDRWTAKMPSEIFGVYEDLAKTIFGSVPRVNAGYAYDRSYYDVVKVGAHSGLDIQGSSGTDIRSAVRGSVARIIDDTRVNRKTQKTNNGWWVAVDELDGSNKRMGRHWWYGHLQQPSVKVGDVINPEQIISKTNYQNHLHLTVLESSRAPNYNDVINGRGKGSYAADVQDVLNRTMSPLQAYWNSRVVMLVSNATGKALDAGGANRTVYQHPTPMPNNSFHLWELRRVGDSYMLISRATGKVLDSGGANGTVYQHPTPMPNNPFHLWELRRVGDSYMLISRATGKVLDAGGANGTVYQHPTPMPNNSFHLWKSLK